MKFGGKISVQQNVSAMEHFSLPQDETVVIFQNGTLFCLGKKQLTLRVPNMGMMLTNDHMTSDRYISMDMFKCKPYGLESHEYILKL